MPTKFCPHCGAKNDYNSYIAPKDCAKCKKPFASAFKSTLRPAQAVAAPARGQKSASVITDEDGYIEDPNYVPDFKISKASIKINHSNKIITGKDLFNSAQQSE